MVAVIIAFAMAVLVVGNSFFQATEQGVQQTYRNSFTADVSVSAVSETPFTLFGNDLPMVGEYEVLPVLPDPDAVERAIRTDSKVEAVVHLVSTLSSVQIAGAQKKLTLFGVDFREYLAAFPGLVVIDGVLPAAAAPGIVLGEEARKAFEVQLGRPLVFGEMIQLSAANAGGFSVRKVPYCGSYRYPVRDDLLDRIALVDADTARALNGYVYGAQRAVDLLPGQSSLLSPAQDIDSLFGDAAPDAVAESKDQLSVDAVEKNLVESRENANAAQAVAGAWNFMLVRYSDPGHATVAGLLLEKTLGVGRSEVQLRDWRGTAGGNSQLVWFLRVIFNIGMVFIVLIAIMVMANAVALSVFERFREIGTMRALGASRGFISRLLGGEVLFLVSGASFVGVLAGSLLVLVLGQVDIPIANPFLASLFGGAVVHVELLHGVVLFHVLLGILIALVALLWPLRVALSIQPIVAMSREA
jgi:ABC-type lipoprotein release transport system permease subunit